MPLVKTIQYRFKGEVQSAKLNVNSKGVFKISLPVEVSRALKIGNEISGISLDEVEKEFRAHVWKFEESNTVESLWISVRFGASGNLNKDDEGRPIFFPHTSSKFWAAHYDQWQEVSSIALGWRVMWKSEIAGVVHWNRASKDTFGTHADSTIHGYYKLMNNDTAAGIMIPFSPEAIEGLKNLEKGLRTIVGRIYKFLDVPEDQLLACLLSASGTLLPPSQPEQNDTKF